MAKISSHTGKNHRARSTAALPSRQVSYLSASNRNPSTLNPSECKAAGFKKCHAVKQNKRLEQWRQSLETLEKWLEKPSDIPPLQVFSAPPSNMNHIILNPSECQVIAFKKHAAEQYRGPTAVDTPSLPSRFTDYISAPIRTGCGMKFDEMAVKFVINKKFPMQLVHPPVETERHHQVPTTPPSVGFAESTSRSQARQISTYDTSSPYSTSTRQTSHRKSTRALEIRAPPEL